MQIDILDGFVVLVSWGIVDVRCVCIVGVSYGGYVVLVGVMLQQGFYCCVVVVVLVSDFIEMYWIDYCESGGNWMVKWNLCESLGDLKIFVEVLLCCNVVCVDVFVLLVYGKDDIVVLFYQSEVMVDVLCIVGKFYEMVVLCEEDYWLLCVVICKQMFEVVMVFVQCNNLVN